MSGFGTCPLCGGDLVWGGDNQQPEHEELMVRNCTCSFCGAYVEAWECDPEERDGYEYWNNKEE